MTFTKKALLFVAMLTVLCSVLPPAAPTVSAAVTPVVELNTTTSTHAFVDFSLPFDTFSSGGPFTVTYEWKTSVASNDPAYPNDACAYVKLIGTMNGTTTIQSFDGHYSYQSVDWQKKSFTFYNVGYYESSGMQIPGNIMRIAMWKAKGSVSIKNLTIKNAAGTVLYYQNTDPDIVALMNDMQKEGIAETDLSNLSGINYQCKWVADCFGSGNYTANLTLDASSTPAPTTVDSGPIFGSTSSSTTTKPTTSSTTTKPTTSSTTTKPTSTSTTTKQTTSSSTTTKPTISSIATSVSTSSSTSSQQATITVIQPTTTQPGSSQQPTSTQNGNMNFWMWFCVIIILFAGFVMMAVFMIQKKRNQE